MSGLFFEYYSAPSYVDSLPPDANDPNDVYYDANQIPIAKDAQGAVILHYLAVDNAGNEGPVGKEVYFFHDVKKPVEDLEAYATDLDGNSPRVGLTWTDPSQHYGFFVYKAVNVHDRKVLEQSRLAGHRPPQNLRLTSPGQVADPLWIDQTVIPGSKVWYGVTARYGGGASLETPISDLVEVYLTTTVGVQETDIDGAMDRARRWLAVQQTEQGYWGSDSASRLPATNQAIRALRRFPTWTANHPLAIQQGLAYLRGNFPDNNTDLATTIDTLQLFGQDSRGPHLRLHLRAYVGDTDRGWGAQERYFYDAVNTALAVKAGKACPSAVPDLDALDDAETVLGKDANNPLASLTAGRYGWVPKGLANVYASAMVYDALCTNVPGADPNNHAYQWILGEQIDSGDGNDGSFGCSLTDTAAVLLRIPIGSTEKAEAEQYLVRKQSPNGSWNADPFLTALCLEALKRAEDAIEDHRYDFNDGNDITLAEYTGVASDYEYVQGSTDYGWEASVDSRDRSSGGDLFRDQHCSTSDRTFLVDVPNGRYKVTLYFGDASYAHDNIDVFAEGDLIIDDLTISAAEYVTKSFIITVSDGQLTLTFHDDGGTDQNWVVCGVSVYSD